MTRERRSWTSYTTVVVPESAPAPRPLLRIIVQAGARRVQPLALVDSGSDETVLPPGLARRLGLWPSVPSTPLDAIGGNIPAGIVHADIRIALDRGPLHIPSVPFRVPLVGDRPRVVILGRHPLFQEAQVTFQDWANRFAIESRENMWWMKRRPLHR